MKLIINGWCFCLFVKRLAYSKRRHRELGFVPQAMVIWIESDCCKQARKTGSSFLQTLPVSVFHQLILPADPADPAGDPLDFASMQKNCSLAAVKRIGNQLKSG